METMNMLISNWMVPLLAYWFLFSIINLILTETFARLSHLRERDLERTILSLLGRELANDFYVHPLVFPPGVRDDQKPSHISKSLFAKLLLDWMLRRDKGTGSIVKVEYKAVVRDIQNNIKSIAVKNRKVGQMLQTITLQAGMRTTTVPELLDLIRQDLETWYSEAGGNKTSLYARHIQAMAAFLGFLMALFLNFDALAIVSQAWRALSARELVDMAQKVNELLPYNVHFNVNLFVMLPVTWDFLLSEALSPAQWSVKLLGILAGGFLITIGSQFIYDLFRKQIRGYR